MSNDQKSKYTPAAPKVESTPVAPTPAVVEPVVAAVAPTVEVTEVAEPTPVVPTPAVVEPPVATPVATKAKVQSVEKPAPTPNNLADVVAQIKKSGTVSQKTVVSVFETYMENMAPGKPIHHDEGAKQQYLLWKTLHNLIHNAPVAEFKQLWNLVLMYFNHHKLGVFHDRYLFRFSEYWIYSIEELNGFQRILNLINLTCDPATRALGLRQVNLNATLSDGFTDEGRQRLLSFYGV